VYKIRCGWFHQHQASFKTAALSKREVSMPKPIIWALIGFGLILFLAGAIAGQVFILFLGLLAIGGGLFLGLGPDGTLTKEQVIDSWAMLIEKAQGKAEEIFGNTDLYIRESKAPSLEINRQQVNPGMIRGLLGAARDFLIVTDKDSLRMQPYKLFLNARDYGDNLDVSWYLTFKPTMLQAALSLIPLVNISPRTVSDIDLFDQQDLRAYSTVVHHSVLRSVEKLMADLSQDPSKIERRSRGFLGIS
jgi:hypothetical protein